jgi:3-deoxy-D-manno-octulosonic-acid transferase
VKALHRLALGSYGVLIEAVAWAALAPLERLRHGRLALDERRGRHPPQPAAAPRLLVHAVSVGEMAGASALLAGLNAASLDASVVLTTGTREGRAAALALRHPRVTACRFLPWDRPRAIRRWLESVRPDAIVVVETELWPGLFEAARGAGIPLLLTSARLYPRDVPRYRLLRPVFEEVLDAAVWIGAQDAGQRDAFVSIGARPERVVVAGNLKDDVPAPGPLPEAWASRLEGSPVVVAGSTHEPEERWLAAACASLRVRHPGLVLVLAPRHPRRAAALREELGRPDVMVVDEVGLLPSLYRAATVAFVGGSLVPHGGHNPLEPARVGRPVVMGPHREHVAEMALDLERAGALLSLADGSPVEELSAAFDSLLADPAQARAMGERGAAVCARRSGAAAACVAALAAALGRGYPAA